MNWDDLRVFLSVARHGGISHAAPALAMDPATVSRRIGRLEQALSTVLFARSSRGFVLTDAGQRLQRQAEEMERAAQALPGIGAARDDLRGTVRIGAPDGCANFLLPQVCAGLRAGHPELALEVLPLGRSFDLQRREVDIAISVTAPASKRVRVEPAGDYELCFAADRRLVAARGGGTGLEGLPLTGYVPDLLLDPALDIPPDYRATEPMLRSSSVMVQWQWIRSGAAAGLLHDFAVPMGEGLVRLLPEVAFARRYYVVSRLQDGPVIETLRTRLRDALAAEMARLRAQARSAWHVPLDGDAGASPRGVLGT